MSMADAIAPDLGALDVEQLVAIDGRIDAHEGGALRDRWEFGRLMLAARDGAGRLPNGYLRELCERTGKSRSEMKYRAQFASTYESEVELANALALSSWRDVVKSLKREAAAVIAPPEIIAVPDGKFGAIVADPPWRYGNTSTRGAAEDHYPTMSIQELCDLDIARERAADQSHLYLWVTAGHLPEGFKVMEAWGFEYKTYLVWVKPQMGMGNYFRVSTELVLFGVRGGLVTSQNNIMNWFEHKRTKHSAKPEQFHDIVMQSSPGPYLELFSRCRADDHLPGTCRCSKCRLNWTVWGNQS